MTKYAKWMVFANFVLAFSFLAWSIGLYSQEMPWQGMIKDKLAPEIKNLTAARNLADQRWADANKAVMQKESERPKRLVYYEEQWKIATTGKNNAGESVTPPVQQLAFNERGLVELRVGAERKPQKLSDNSEARSRAGYETAIAKALDETRDVKQKINKVVQDTTVLTQQIKGTKVGEEAITAVERGLRSLVNDAIHLWRNIQLEQEFLQTPLTNVNVDLEMLKRRQSALEARLKELGGA